MRTSPSTIAGFMAALSIVAVVVLPKKAIFAALALPGAYGGLVLSMVVGGNHHGPGDPYSWVLFAAPINFAFYYGLVRVVAKVTPSLF